MEKEKFFFAQLKNIKDYWVEKTIQKLDKNYDLHISNEEKSYKKIQEVFKNQEEIDSYQKVINDVIEGVLHSVMVMLDGGDELADNIMIDIIDIENKNSILKEGSYHEEFISYLTENE